MIAIVDDDKNLCDSIALDFREDGHEVSTFYSLEDFLRSDNKWSYIILDLKIGESVSTNFVTDIRQANQSAKIIILTGFGSITSSVEAIKKGADDYLLKPISYSLLKQRLIHVKENTDKQEDQDIKILSLDRAEREYIEFVLTSCSGNISQAAKKLGIHRQSLQRKLKKFTPN